MPIFAFFVLFFFLELFLMVMAAVEHGWGWGVFWFEVATAILGVALIRHNQEVTMRSLFQQAGGRVRPDFSLALFRSARVTVGGILLILPGFITDGFGAALLILPGLHTFLLRLLKAPAPPRQPPEPPDSNESGRIIEGEVEPPRKDSKNRTN